MRSIRLAELAAIEQDIVQLGPRILEVGAGFGWQAERLSERGLEVTALDIESSKYTRYSAYPIQLYDGSKLPFPDNSFDVVYSSQMLHEVPDQEAFLKEQARVLKPEGTLIHSLPSAQVRILGVLLHHVWAVQEGLRRLRGVSAATELEKTDELEAPIAAKLLGYLRHALFPMRVGTRGTWLHEIFWFTEAGWRSLFTRSGLAVKAVRRSGLCYSPHTLLGSNLSLDRRRKLARTVGSSSLFIFAKRP